MCPIFTYNEMRGRKRFCVKILSVTHGIAQLVEHKTVNLTRDRSSRSTMIAERAPLPTAENKYFTVGRALLQVFKGEMIRIGY